MPRDSNGNYTLPSGNPVITGTTIDTNWANPTMADLGNEIQDSLSRSGQGGMLVPFKNADGTVAAPGVTWNNETITGIYRANPNDMRVSVGAQDVFRWTATATQVWVGDEWIDVGVGQQLVSSVFGREGDILAEESDYEAFQVDFDNTNAPAWDVTNVQDALDEAYSNIEFLAGAVTLKGVWDADANEPDILTIPKINGNYWIVSVPGTTPLPDFPDGSDPIIDHQVFDRVVFIDDGTDSGWEQLRPEGDSVSSVFGRIGNVTAQEEDYDEFYATTAQGDLADSALQSGDNVSELVNDASYITSAQAPMQSVFGRSGIVAAQASDYDAVQVDFDNANTPVWGGLTVQDVIEDAYDTIEFLAGAVVLKGVWDATANIPDLLTITKVSGNYWIVSEGGSTVLPLYPGAPAFQLPYAVLDRIVWLDDGLGNSGFGQLRPEVSDYLPLTGGTMIGDILLAAQGTAVNSVVRKDYTDAQIATRAPLAQQTPVGATALNETDLNTLSTDSNAGFYFQSSNANATPERNYPTQRAGCLVINRAAGITQTYTSYQNGDVYTRAFYTSAWSVWRRLSFIDDVVANATNAVNVTGPQAAAITANTAKVGITAAEQAAIVANTAKVGITPAQSSAITANTSGVAANAAAIAALPPAPNIQWGIFNSLSAGGSTNVALDPPYASVNSYAVTVGFNQTDGGVSSSPQCDVTRVSAGSMRITNRTGGAQNVNWIVMGV